MFDKFPCENGAVKSPTCKSVGLSGLCYLFTLNNSSSITTEHEQWRCCKINLGLISLYSSFIDVTIIILYKIKENN